MLHDQKRRRKMRHKTDPRTATRSGYELRRFPHANSMRKIAGRFEADAKEAGEYTSSPLHLRNGKCGIMSVYEDVPPATSKTWVTKPKEYDFDRATIRRMQENDLAED